MFESHEYEGAMFPGLVGMGTFCKLYKGQLAVSL